MCVRLSYPQRIVLLVDLASSVCSSLSSVEADALVDTPKVANEFYSTLRHVYASLCTHIRAQAGETPSAPGGAAGVVASEYRRNVYLDTQAMHLTLDNLDIYKQRIEEIAHMQPYAQQRQTTVAIEGGATGSSALADEGGAASSSDVHMESL
jgi:hypothetical protein